MMHVRNIFTFRDIFNNSRNLLSPNRYIPVLSNDASTKTIEEKVGLPPKPKKPLTPYFKFLKQMRPNVIAENPNTKTTDVVKILANKWKTIDDDSKKKLEEEYKKEQISYVEKRAKYDSKLTDTQKKEIKQMKQEVVEARERRAFKKRIRELGKPKRPPSAFLKFILQERSVSPPPSNMSHKDWLKKVTDKWSRLSETEKEKFKNETKKDLEKYKQEISKWENKMIRLGNMDVVRQDALIEPSTSKTKKIA